MFTVYAGSWGKVYLLKDVREGFGEKFRVVRLESSIKLIPVSDDSVEGLKEAMAPLKDVSIEEMEKTVEEEAQKQV